MDRITFLIDEETKRSLKVYLAKRGQSITDALTRCINGILGGSIDISPLWLGDAAISETETALAKAAQAAIEQIVEMEPHWEPENERPTLRMLRAALAPFEEVEDD